MHDSHHAKKELIILNQHYCYKENGGGRGIRTPAGFDSPVGFQDRSLQPNLGIPPYTVISNTGGPCRTRTCDRTVMSRLL